MGILGVKLSKKANLKDIKKQYEIAKGKLSIMQKYRPETRERFRDVLTAQDNVLIPTYPFEEDRLYDLALHSDALRIGLNALNNRIFRRGFKVISKMNEPNLVQEAELNQLQKRINQNKQSIKTLSEQFEWDLDVMDNAFLIAIKDYYFDFSGKIIDKLTTTKEIIRASPTKIRLIADFQGNLGVTPEGKKLYCSPDNRSQIYDEQQAENLGFYDPTTKKEMRQVFFRAEREQGQFIYYFEEEVFYTNKHNPSLLYGYSLIFACWMKVLTLIYMDRFLMNAYRRGRPPRGLLTIGTTNFQSLKKAWEELKSKAREDPHSIEPLAYEIGQNNRGGSVNWIDLMKPLTEMQYIESRNEFRRSILALWGIMPLFAGDVASSGGLNNEGEQITVSDIAVEKGQKIFNDEVYPWILSQFGITDYELILQEPEEQDELEDTKVLQVKIDNAQKMRQMGFDITYFPKEKDFEFSEKPTEPMQGQQPFSPFNQSEFMDLSKEIKKQESPVIKGIADLVKYEKSLINKSDNFFNKDLEDVLIERITKLIWAKTFEGLSLEKSNKVKELIINGITENKSLNDVIKGITKLGVSKRQAEMIARTESANIQNDVREELFKDLKVEKVFWQIAHDNRVSDVCKTIHERTKQGVSIAKLKEIAHKTAKEFGLKPRSWVMHPMERSTIGII